MATSMSKKRRKTTATKKGDASLVGQERKKEVLGLILIVLALLVTLALLTYAQADDPSARSFSFERALNPGDDRAQNALGLVGAAVAYALVPNFLGYTTLLLVGLLFGWGYVLFRRKTPLYLPLVTLLVVVGAFFLACLFGWFGQTLDAGVELWAGSVGLGVAGWMQRIFGTVGSFIVLLALLAVTVLLVVDHDIQRSLDRAEELFASMRERLWLWWAGSKERRDERRVEIARRRAERRKEREQHLKERERERERARRNAPAP